VVGIKAQDVIAAIGKRKLYYCAQEVQTEPVMRYKWDWRKLIFQNTMELFMSFPGDMG
jgi:hypothetical protein